MAPRDKDVRQKRSHFGNQDGPTDFGRAREDASLVKIEKTVDPDRFGRLRGLAGKGLTTDQIMAMTRAEPK